MYTPNTLTRHDVNEQVSQLLLEHGGATSNFALAVEDLRSKYLKNGIDFPFVNIPEK